MSSTTPRGSNKRKEGNPEKTPRETQVKQNRTGRMMLFILLGLALTISVFLVLLYPSVMVTTSKEANIKIPAKATAQTVRDSLTKYYGDDFASHVMRLAKFRGADFSKRHGAYTIPAGTNALSAMRKLTSGAQTPVRVTINGFRSMPKLVELVTRKMEFPEDSLMAVINDEAFLSQYGLTPANALALFVDDTYEVYWTTSARDLLKKIGENYKYLWNAERTRQAAELGLTPAETMIIASIVDEETNQQDEKGTIGRLYSNRLKSGMKLQADPTVRYALGDFTIQRITHQDLLTDSPYNTYRYAGLPPGPIRTTSEATVKAILWSEPSNYLYMCAKEDFSGGHNFASTYQEHLENARRYQSALDSRGIKR